jgi:murein DD-endopeptidase MepM/ murein hydrolase activator NlpD
MTNFVRVVNAEAAHKFRNLFQPRDIFVHDGRGLRRIALSTPVQMGMALAALLLFAWSIFATVQLTAGPVGTSADRDVVRMARMAQQVEAMNADVAALKKVAQQRYHYTATEMRKLGLEPSRFETPAYQGQGGPFEAVEPLKAGDPKFKQLFMSWKKLDQLEKGSIAIPSSMPVSGTNFTSGFGVRSDPFRGRAAMHAGIDLAGPMGTKIYATADGVVGRSGWVNGYGNLVELNHGRGIQTRFGHLSRSLVTPGQHVKRGDLIALMGSTGRSTGSHLHYEVRIDGKAVNPVPFMQTNDYLLALQRRAAGTNFAMGGPAGK